MAAPNETQVRAQIEDVVQLLHNEYTSIATDSPNVVGLLDAAQQAAHGEFTDEYVAALERLRANRAGAISRDQARALLDPLIKSYARAVGIKATTVDEILPLLYRYFHDNSETVNSRDVSLGSISLSGTGNGTMYRVGVDEYGYDIEGNILATESFEAECILHQGMGIERHEEVFTLRGALQSKDGLERLGSSQPDVSMPALSARNSMILNASFSDGTGGSSLTNWTLSSGSWSDTDIDTSNYYRDFPGDTTPAALQLGGNLVLAQTIKTAGIRFDNVPHIARFAYNRQVGSGAMTLTVRVGAQSVAIALSAQTGWNLVTIPSSIGQNSWPLGLYEDEMDITIEISSYSSGTVLVDDFILAPMTRFAGGYYAIVGGTTPFKKDDIFTWTHTISSDSKIQYWLQWAYPDSGPNGADFCLPSATSAGESWSDPS